MTAIIFYHAGCPDGFGAAYAAWRQFGELASYRPVFHGQVPSLESVAGRQVFILDMAFSREQLTAMAEVAVSVQQLDHHISARDAWIDELGPAADGLQRWSHPELPLTVSFDMNKSGARLAWEFFHPDLPMPWPLRHVEDRDLWRFALPATRSFCRALQLLPFEFNTWDLVMQQAGTPGSRRYQDMLAEGEAIERFYQAEIDRLSGSTLVMPVQLPGGAIGREHAVRQGQPFIEDGQGVWRLIPGLAINANGLFTSELGERLADKCGSFALVWNLASDGMVRAGLRAKGQVDVAKMAERYGGGGHRDAAGFEMPVMRFMTEILGQKIPDIAASVPSVAPTRARRKKAKSVPEEGAAASLSAD